MAFKTKANYVYQATIHTAQQRALLLQNCKTN